MEAVNNTNTTPKMDKETLRRVVINLRDSGLTFQAISDTLMTKYGVKRTKQAVRDLYYRSTNGQTAIRGNANRNTNMIQVEHPMIGKNEANKGSGGYTGSGDLGNSRLLALAMNTYCRGYNITATHKIVRERGYEISYQKLSELLSNRKVYQDGINNSLVAETINLINEGANLDIIQKALSFDGIVITDNKLQEVLSKALKFRINTLIMNECNRYSNAGLKPSEAKKIGQSLIETLKP